MPVLAPTPMLVPAPGRLTERINVLAAVETAKIRKDSFQGVEHLVVPVVALVEGVLQPLGATSPELALASEFAKFPQGWDGRPVVMNHPKSPGGVPISANNPITLQLAAFGLLFNTKLDGTRLKTEAWVNTARVKELGGEVEKTVTRVAKGELIEVSVGLLAEIAPEVGMRDGKKFEGVWRNIVPDHLAFLSEGSKGACSIDDGCGAPRAAQVNCTCGGTCEKCREVKVAQAPNLEITFSEHRPSALRSMFDSVAEFLGLKATTGLSDKDKRSALQSALRVAMPQGEVFVMAVFEGEVVYEAFVDNSFGLFKRAFSIAEDGTISLGADIEQVRPETRFVPVKTKEVTMSAPQTPTTAERVKALIANKRARFTAEDERWLLTLTAEQLGRVEPTAEEPAAPVAPAVPAPIVAAAPVTPAAPAPTAVAPASPATPKTLETYVNEAPPEVRDMLNEGIRMRQARKNELITSLKACGRCEFTEPELAAMPIQSLERLAKLSNLPSYVGSAGARMTSSAADDNAPPPMPEPFPAGWKRDKPDAAAAAA